MKRISPIMRHFEYRHLPERLAAVSKEFAALAMWVNEFLPDCAERSVALRKLLEAKDAAVRAKLEDEPAPAAQAEIGAVANEGVDTSDIPEAGADFFKRAKLVSPGGDR